MTVVHENLFVTSSRTWEIAAQRLEVLFYYLDAGLLVNLSCSDAHEVSALIDHACWRLQQSGLDWHSVLLNEKQFLVNEHENSYCVSPEEDVGGWSMPVFLRDSAHIDKAHPLSEHLHSQDLNLEHAGTRFETVELLYIVPELLAGLDLGQDALAYVWEGEDGDYALLESQLERLIHM